VVPFLYSVISVFLSSCSGLKMDAYEDDEPPGCMDIPSRGVSPVSLLLREIRRYASGVDFVCPLPGSGIRRRHLNLPDIRAEG
jgi:hypothetical protein